MRYKEVSELVLRYPSLAVCEDAITELISELVAVFREGGKLLVCGNGGSASDSLHIAGELMKSFKLPRPLSPEYRAALRERGANGEYLATALEGALPVIALVDSPALSTAFCNDREAGAVFAQQVAGLGRPGDMLLVLTTSGNSRNCILAAVAAGAAGMRVAALTGEGGGEIAGTADVTVAVPASETFRVQELHLPVYHALCAAVESEFFGAEQAELS